MRRTPFLSRRAQTGGCYIDCNHALGPAGVWAFGVIYPLESRGPLQRPLPRAQRRVRLPAEPLTVSALSRDDMCAIGPTVNTAARGLDQPASAGVDGRSRAVGRWLWDGWVT